MLNRYEVNGKETIIFLESKKFGIKTTLIDTEDLPKVSEINWNLHQYKDTNIFYCTGSEKLPNGKTKTVRLHRILTQCPKELDVDHINHNTLDNRKANLRMITKAQNNQNRNGSYKTSKSGIRGVSWDKEYKSWRVCVSVNGKRKSLGRFKDINDAKTFARLSRALYMPFSEEALKSIQ